VNAILHFYFAVLEPFFRFFYPACDWLFSWWALYLPPVWAIAAVGFITGMSVNLFQKFFSNQKLLTKCQDDLKLLGERIAAAKKAGDEEAQVRLTALSRQITNKSVVKSVLPSLWTVPPVIVLCMWIASRLAYFPVKVNEPVKVTASMEAGARDFATMLPCEGAEIKAMKKGPLPKAEPVKEDDSKAEGAENESKAEKARKEAEKTKREIEKMKQEALAQSRLEAFNSRVAEINPNWEDPKKKVARIDDIVDSSKPAWYKPWKWIYVPPQQNFHPWKWKIQDEADRLAWIKDRVTAGAPPAGPEANWEVRFARPGDYTLVIRYKDQDHPVKIQIREKGGHAPEVTNYFLWSSPTEDQLQFVNFDLTDNMPSADWNLGWRWIGLYCLVAIVFGVGLRFALGIK
jgi:uncharacterized membrane protein (DUF106 family)